MTDIKNSVPIDLKQAFVDPGSIFESPEALLENESLSKEQKAELLRRWEYDASEDDVASEEGMPNGESNLLHRILLSLDQLTGGLDTEQVGPTKQHGLPRSSIRIPDITPAQKTGAIREAVGYFETVDALQEAIDDLMSAGFDRAELSLLAAEHAVEEKLGHKYTRVAELEDDPKVARCCYVSTESVGDAEGGLIGTPLYVAATAAAGVILASGGTMAAAIIGAALAGGAGGLIGGLLAKLVGDHHGHHLQEQLEHGGLLLWVRTRDAAHEQRAVGILKKHSGQDVHVHAITA